MVKYVCVCVLFCTYEPTYLSPGLFCTLSCTYVRTCRFHLQLVTFAADKSTALLDVVEANPFKHLTHLSLKVLLAGDSVLKKYLAECLISLRVCMYISDAYVCMYVSILYTLVSTGQ